MQLQNFECQIAKGQIGRYLAGDALSEEAVRQLEAHIASCRECKHDLEERKAALRAALSEDTIDGSDRASVPLDSAKLPSLGSRIRSRLLTRAVVQMGPKPATYVKPALYSLALGAVLIAMSLAGRNMDSVLGSKAATPTSKQPMQARKSGTAEPGRPAVTAHAAPSTTIPRESKSVPAPAADSPSDPGVMPRPTMTRPKPPEPSVSISRKPTPAPRKTSRRKSRPKRRAPQVETDTIRVYDPEN